MHTTVYLHEGSEVHRFDFIHLVTERAELKTCAIPQISMCTTAVVPNRNATPSNKALTQQLSNKNQATCATKLERGSRGKTIASLV